jgi:hypothetical protein
MSVRMIISMIDALLRIERTNKISPTIPNNILKRVTKNLKKTVNLNPALSAINMRQGIQKIRKYVLLA